MYKRQGKTTMVKLLMRFYVVAVQGDGAGVHIMENIRYGRLDATAEEVIAAAKAANADHFIRTRPGGYQIDVYKRQVQSSRWCGSDRHLRGSLHRGSWHKHDPAAGRKREKRCRTPGSHS